ncbi:energy-coupling factor transporter transmembrane component T family protein [Streptococcus sp. 10F2]
MFPFDRYAYQNRIGFLDSRIKGFMYLLLLIAAFSNNRGIQLTLLLLLPILTCYLAKLSWKTYRLWLLYPLPFILMSFVTILIQYSNSPLDLTGSIPFLGGFLGWQVTSWPIIVALFLRIYTSIMASYLFIVSISFHDLMKLLRQLRLPLFLIEIIVLMHRFIFLLLEEYILMRDTLDLKFSFGKWNQKIQMTALLWKTLFIRMLEKQERLQELMELRFDNQR